MAARQAEQVFWGSDLHLRERWRGSNPQPCCFQASGPPSTAYWRVLSLQVGSGGSSRQCGPVGPSTGRWNDRQNDIAELASAPQPSEAGWLLAGEGDADLGFMVGDGSARDVVDHAVEAGEPQWRGVYVGHGG